MRHLLFFQIHTLERRGKKEGLTMQTQQKLFTNRMLLTLLWPLVVEQAPARVIFTNCEKSHPYTEGLMYSIPRLNDDRKKLDPIPGAVPHPLDLPKGCKFHTRCPYATERCKTEAPQQREVEPGHYVVCHLYEK